MRVFIFMLTLLTSTAAFAQQTQRPPSTSEMQGIISGLSAQLDSLRNLHMQAEMKAAKLDEENAGLRARIVESVEKKTAPDPQ